MKSEISDKISSCTTSASGKAGLFSIKTSNKPIKNRLLTNDSFKNPLCYSEKESSFSGDTGVHDKNMDKALGLDLLFIEE